ncbi:thioesterase [Pseudomonas sp. S75]|uniref:thioesterase II family protein n=1 Tax=unclassified Pseudomonas TaxID=196821 RepID=UPI00190307ED|nr:MULTISPECIES: alpha/beta fold hydrolase [unclassified Pseudomonas]MBJ9977638.1 thioesterase [Pseudomonas sp. S30]MBK0155010.1 thioesterase [Pseudomonas sp. S75]
MDELNTRALTRRKDSWFVRAGRRDPAVPNLYCFAHAGGSAEQFLAWQRSLAGVVNIVAMCPPGLAHRYTEPRCDDMISLAVSASAAIDSDENRVPFMLFGHSFGALLAYETCRLLDRPAAELIVSGCAAPSWLPSREVVAMAALEGADFLDKVRIFGGIPTDVETDEIINSYIVKKLKVDFTIIAKYLYVRDPLLNANVTTLNGVSDPHVSAEKVMAWSATTTGTTLHHAIPGDHFYFNERPDAVIEIIRALSPTAHHRAPALDVRLI